MKVRMIADVSGTRDGKDWPKRGELVDIPDAEARDLIVARVAAEADDKDAEAEVNAELESTTLTTGTGPVESAAADTKPKPRPATTK